MTTEIAKFGTKALADYRQERAKHRQQLRRRIATAKTPTDVLAIIEEEIGSYVDDQFRKGALAVRVMSLEKLARRLFERRTEFDYIWSALKRARKAQLYRAIRNDAISRPTMCPECGEQVVFVEALKREQEINRITDRLKSLGLTPDELERLLNEARKETEA